MPPPPRSHLKAYIEAQNRRAIEQLAARMAQDETRRKTEPEILQIRLHVDDYERLLMLHKLMHRSGYDPGLYDIAGALLSEALAEHIELSLDDSLSILRRRVPMN